MIDIQRLVKRFGAGAAALTAVDGVSFSVARGEVLGFLGPNGAGKSTTMKMVTGYLAPTSGSAVVGGHDVLKDPIAVKQKVGYLPEGAPAYPDMTPWEFLKFIAQVRGIPPAHRRARIEEVAALVHLEGVMRQTIDTLSKGYKRRVGLAQAILHDPEVLIMDEPTDGLDPNQKHEVRALIRRMAPTKAIVLSTHILEEVEAVCTRAVIINRGRLVADGTPADLCARARTHNAVRMTVKAPAPQMPPEAIRAEVARLPGVAAAEITGVHDGHIALIAYPEGHGAGRRAIAPELSAHARLRGWVVDELHIETGRLDEVFRTITTDAHPGGKETR